MEKKITVKIYYEDTDCLGIVYHANYLKFLERGRTEFFNSSGKPITQWNKEGYNFAVYEMQIKFRQAARLGDVCEVVTSTMEGGSEYRKKMKQKFLCNGVLLTEAVVDIVCLDKDLQLIEFPKGAIE